MRRKFTYSLINFSNTINRLLKEYYGLYSQVMSMKIENNLMETFDEIQTISNKIRSIQQNFQEQLSSHQNELPEKWKLFGVKLGEHIDAAVEHTHTTDELINLFSTSSTWERIWKARKIINLFSRMNKSAKKSSQKGAELNQLINSGQYTNP